MSPARDAYELVRDGFPRVSGDEPKEESGALVRGSFSPRERG